MYSKRKIVHHQSRMNLHNGLLWVEFTSGFIQEFLVVAESKLALSGLPTYKKSDRPSSESDPA